MIGHKSNQIDSVPENRKMWKIWLKNLICQTHEGILQLWRYMANIKLIDLMCGIQSISSRVSCSTLPMWHSQSKTAIESPLPSLTGGRGTQVGMLRRWVITTPFAPFWRCPHQPGHAKGVPASHCWLSSAEAALRVEGSVFRCLNQH